MPIDYTWKAKTARMEAVRSLLDGGHLVLMAEDRVTRIGDIQLEIPSGVVMAGLLMLSGFPKFCEAFASGEIKRAALYGASGELIAGGLTVGIEKEADIVVNQVAVSVGNLIKIDAAELRHA